MPKSGWAAATGLGSLVLLLLAACGGTSSSSASATGTTQATTSSSSSAMSSSASASAANSGSGGSTSQPSPKPGRHTAGPQPSSGGYSFPPQGTTFLAVTHTAIGYVLAKANGDVVYVYAHDKKGGSPTCLSACAATWTPVTGIPKESPGFSIPGAFAVVKGAGGVEQVTYNGYPLYLYKGAAPHSTSGNGVGGVWHVISMSARDIG